MVKTILLVEDDQLFREALRTLLSSKYEVTEAQDGKMAREILNLKDFDLILSDIQMPFFSGVDLLEWVRKNKTIPVILMTGFSHVLETQKAYELGAADFIPKPFKNNELFEKIAAVLGEKNLPPAAVERVDLDAQFCKIPLEDFIAEKQTDYGIYIRISQFKYIKISHEGGKIPEDKIALFKQKGVTFLYIRQEDFSKLVGFTVALSKAVAASNSLDDAKKQHFLQHTAEMIMQQAFVAGTDEALFRTTKDFLTTSLGVMTQDDETFMVLQTLSQHSDYLYAHSVGVSMFSVMIAKQMGWTSAQTLFKLAFAGLFHDIGKKEIPKETLEKPRAALTQQERALLETHTTRGQEILESLKTAPSEVIQVAYEHHEDAIGQGYPQGLSRLRIHPLSLVVMVANTFCEYTIRSPQNLTPRTGHAAIQAMQAHKLSSLDPTAFQALVRVMAASHEEVAS